MRNTLGIVVTGIGLALLSVPADAQVRIQQENTNVGTSSAEFLLLGAGARGMALGGGFAALVDDVESVYYNPAGLPLMENEIQGKLSYMPYFADTDYLFIGAAFPFAANQYALGFSFGNFGFSDQPIFTEEDPDGTSGETYSVNESFIGISFAHAFIDRFTGGFTLKFIQDRLGEASAQSFALDVGTNFHTDFAGRPIAFAVVIQNLGGNLEHSGEGLRFDAFPPSDDPSAPGQNVDPSPAEFRAQSFPLPTTFRVGLSYDLLSMANNRVSLLGQFVEQNNTDPTWGFAGEYEWAPEDAPLSAALRGSYTYQADNFLSDNERQTLSHGLPAGNRWLDGLAVGGGLTYRLADYEASLDYTFRHFGFMGSRNVFTFGLALR